MKLQKKVFQKTALHFAVETNNLEIVQLLLNIQRINVNATYIFKKYF